MKYILPFIIPIILAGMFWQIDARPDSFWWVMAIAIILIWFTCRVLSGKYFWQYLRLWLNLSLVYATQVLFSIHVISDVMFFWLILAWLLIWIIIFWLLGNYFKHLKNVKDLDYLSFNRFVYYLGFWLLSTSLYYMIFFITFSVWYSVLIIVAAVYLWGSELIILADEKINRFFIWLLIFTSAQVFLAVYLLPVSYLVSGSITALWFFFIVDYHISQAKKISSYLLLILVSITLLLISSLI